METEELRRASHQIAEAIAPGWERRREFVEEVSTPVREWIIRELAPESGQTLLELAAGAGDTGFEAAAIVGEQGQLISTDFSESMVEVARRRGDELGIGNVDYRVMDAERIELEDDSVDGVLCRFGYMLMVDPAAAFSETRRVLRPGGRLALAVWAGPERNPFFAIVAMALVQGGHMPPPDPVRPSPFKLGNEEQTRAMIKDAGFENVRLEAVPVRFAFGDVDEYLSITADTAGPIGVALRELSDDEREALKAHLEQAFERFAADSGYELPGIALCAVAS